MLTLDVSGGLDYTERVTNVREMRTCPAPQLRLELSDSNSAIRNHITEDNEPQEGAVAETQALRSKSRRARTLTHRCLNRTICQSPKMR